MITIRQLLLSAGIFCIAAVHAQTLPGTGNYSGFTKNPSPQNGNATLGPVFDSTVCGLGYVQASQKLGKRFHVSCCPAVDGVTQPAPFVISGIPANANILRAYLWYMVSGTGSNFVCTVKNPLNVQQNYSPNLVGSDQDICWGSGGCRAYRQNITNIISGNGTYYVSGLPTDTVANGLDVDGATLFIIYADPTDQQRGTLLIDDGMIGLIGGNGTHTISGFNACSGSITAKGFEIVADLQQINSQFMINGGPTFQIGTAENWWNFIEQPTTVNANQSSSNYAVMSSGDCVGWIVAGLYYKTACVACCQSTFTLTMSSSPDSCNASGTATATITGGVPPYTYQWNTIPAQTTSTATGLTSGNYAVYCTDSNGCSSGNITVTYTGMTLSTTQINAACNSTGSATVNVTGGNGPYTYSWNTGPVQTTQTATGLIAGNYSVVVTDAGGCTRSAQVTITNPGAPVVTASSVATNCGNNGSATATVTGGNPPYTYSWTTSPVQTTSSATGLAAGSYTVYVTDNNGCSALTVVAVNANAMTLNASANPPNIGCNGSSQLIASSNFNCTFVWMPSTGLSCTTCANPIAVPTANTTYTVVAYSACDTMSQTVTLTVDTMNMLSENICMVTVDTSINKNVVIWERTVSYPVVSYNIYKETSQANVYALIGNQPLSTFTTYTDMSSTPQQIAARYKISTVDTCGGESFLSPHHKTIHLSISAGINNSWNLLWDQYEGFNFLTYDIYRGATNSSMALIAQVQSNLLSYTDVNVPPGSQYVIVAVNPNACNPSLHDNGNQPQNLITMSMSNVCSTLNIGMGEHSGENSFLVFPDPSQGQFTIDLQNALNIKTNYTVYDVLGKQISSGEIKQRYTSIDLSSAAKGIYFVTIRSTSGTCTQKVVIE